MTTRADEIARLLDSGGDVIGGALDNAPASDWNTLLNKPALVASATTDTTNADNISSGTLVPARMGASPSAGKYLRGDNTWQTNCTNHANCTTNGSGHANCTTNGNGMPNCSVNGGGFTNCNNSSSNCNNHPNCATNGNGKTNCNNSPNNCNNHPNCTTNGPACFGGACACACACNC
tara:strand:- start:9496 stop:10026 length:531 start_codon:yes stop_codon:yes gene_type:complete